MTTLFDLLIPGDNVRCEIYPDEQVYINETCPQQLGVGVVIRQVYDFYEVAFGDIRRIVDANKLKRVEERGQWRKFNAK